MSSFLSFIKHITQTIDAIALGTLPFLQWSFSIALCLSSFVFIVSFVLILIVLVDSFFLLVAWQISDLTGFGK